MDENRGNTGLIVGIIVVILLVAGGAWWYMSSGTSAPVTAPQQAVTGTSTTSTNTTGANTGAGSPGSAGSMPMTGSSAPMQATVTYTDQGFSPQNVTVMQGGTVTFVNQSSHQMWIASNPHPVHTGYDGTSVSQHCAAGYSGPAPFDECTAVNAGGSFSFTFNKTGSWGYHNHALHSDTGTVTVQ